MKQWIKRDEQLLHEIEHTCLSGEETAFWNLGQTGFLFRQNGRTFLIDPVLNDLPDAQGISKRLYPSGLDPKRVTADAVFCTHAHRDHMALETLQGLYQVNPDILFIVPAGEEHRLLEAGIPQKNIRSARHKEEMDVCGMQVLPVRTAHPQWTEREDGTENSLAYAIQAGETRLLHLGDTYLCKELVEDLEQLAPVNILFAPINGQDYFRTARGCIGNLNPCEAAKTAELCQADLTIPTHYDMMKGNTCSPLPFLEQMQEVFPAGKCALPSLGERILYQP